MVHAERTLMFSTDYPHFDQDLPARTLNTIPEAMRSRVMYENALESFERLHIPLPVAAS
jgi:predicted TIM-barrel fold metal-dependent hydrolase